MNLNLNLNLIHMKQKKMDSSKTLQCKNVIILKGTQHNQFSTFYTTDKNKKTMPEKMEIKKFDPKARKHVMYKEAKIK